MKTPLFVLGLFFFAMACVELDVEKQSCDPPVMCTKIYKTVSVQLKDAKGAAIRLDSFRVTILPEGKDITRPYEQHQLDSYRDYGSYPVVSDSDDFRFQRFTPTRVLFEGFIADKKVVSTEYIIQFDCCHVELVSKEPDVIVVH